MTVAELVPDRSAIRIESFLSARLFLSPQRAGDRLYFISNISGRLSLYAMDVSGSVPEPLLPPGVALQNPVLQIGSPYAVFPDMGAALVMMDRDGDENYQPMRVPLAGGYPEPWFGETFSNNRAYLMHSDREHAIAYFNVDSREEPLITAYKADLRSGNLTRLGASPYGHDVRGVNADHTKVILVDTYTLGDNVVYLWEQGRDEPRLIYGVPLEERGEGQQVPLNRISVSCFTPGDEGLLFYTSLFDDAYGIGYMRLDPLADPEPVIVEGLAHSGQGEFYNYEHALEHLDGDRYLLRYNIDGASWGYEALFDEDALQMSVERVLWGQNALSDGVAQSASYDESTDSFALSFSTATSPAQIYTLDGGDALANTRERVMGIPNEWLSPGEDASYDSFDGLRVSARLYRPSAALGFEGPRPLAYYVHGGPQSQERPDFTWFSMPLIQFLTLHGFAVFVPNARGSTGYGLSYTKHVDRDWGGNDRLDHVHAMGLLGDDPLIDTSRAGVVGRSYGGYMTLMLAGRNPDLWSAVVDMFGPYDLITFSERIPPTWKPYYKLAIGDPDDPADREHLIEMSPKTYLHQLSCPMLVIQGANDPRVVEAESRDLVNELKQQGKDIEILVFENEGHDVLKHDNRVRVYNEITGFFIEHLNP